jgi:hypothetical protein
LRAWRLSFQAGCRLVTMMCGAAGLQGLQLGHQGPAVHVGLGQIHNGQVIRRRRSGNPTAGFGCGRGFVHQGQVGQGQAGPQIQALGRFRVDHQGTQGLGLGLRRPGFFKTQVQRKVHVGA